MADSSSDDELPLAQRPVENMLLGGSRPPAAADSSDESDIPSWLQAPAGAKGKGNQVVNLTDSDSDDGAVVSPAKPAPAAAPAAADAAPPTEPPAAGNRDVQQPASQPQTQPPQQPPPRSAAKPKGTPRRRPAGATSAAAAAAAAPTKLAEDSQLADPLASQPGPSSQVAPASQLTAGGGGTAQKQRGGAAAGLPHAPTSQMSLVLPEKLPQIKMLVELESGGAEDTHGVTDLSGDSGAIGRLMMGGTKEEPQMQVDLKGVLYNATIVPCPVSLAVINMGIQEAKVECLFTEFVQLREDTRFSFTDGDQLLVEGDDDDVFAGGPDGTAAGDGGGGAAAAPKKGRGKAAAAGGKAATKAAPRKRAAPKAKGGVKKGGGGTSKPRAKPKPKPKAAKKK